MAKRTSRRGEPPTEGAAEAPLQNPHELVGTEDNRLEIAIGRQVRDLRRKHGITVVELAKIAGISQGMLSKIENGAISPSLGTLKALSHALNVPVTTFFRRYEEQRSATFVRRGEGLTIERRGTRAGHQYQLLGHMPHNKSVTVEPYFITLTKQSEIFPFFQHAGLEFIYLIEGRIAYRHADKVYTLDPGDSLFFDAEAPHGPEELLELPIRFISIISYGRSGDE